MAQGWIGNDGPQNVAAYQPIASAYDWRTVNALREQYFCDAINRKHGIAPIQSLNLCDTYASDQYQIWSAQPRAANPAGRWIPSEVWGTKFRRLMIPPDATFDVH
jgi:hypothetical protein